jgi:hypothetical protein
MAGRKVERALAAKSKRRHARTGKSTPATCEGAVLEAKDTALNLRRVPGPCATHLRFDSLTGRVTMVPAMAPAPYLSPAGVTAEESFLGEEVHAALPSASVCAVLLCEATKLRLKSNDRGTGRLRRGGRRTMARRLGR